MSDLIPMLRYGRIDQHPAAVYLNGLAPGSRRSMRQALNVIAGIIAEGADASAIPWQEMRYQHTTAVRAALAEKYGHTSATDRTVSRRWPNMCGINGRMLLWKHRATNMCVTRLDRAVKSCYKRL